jgi:hypothetical protein
MDTQTAAASTKTRVGGRISTLTQRQCPILFPRRHGWVVIRLRKPRFQIIPMILRIRLRNRIIHLRKPRFQIIHLLSLHLLLQRVQLIFNRRGFRSYLQRLGMKALFPTLPQQAAVVAVLTIGGTLLLLSRTCNVLKI